MALHSAPACSKVPLFAFRETPNLENSALLSIVSLGLAVAEELVSELALLFAVDLELISLGNNIKISSAFSIPFNLAISLSF